MSTNTPQNQEVDLSMVSKGIGNFVQYIKLVIFRAIQFVIKHVVVIGILFAIGVGLGLYLDKTQKTYDHQIIVQPNFGSVDYLYAKVDLLESKILEKDTVFLEKIGLHNPSAFSRIDIKPVVDVYRFINTSEQNFELLKLMSEDSDIKKIVEERATSKNYPYHVISLKSKARISHTNFIEPLMAYLNNSAHYAIMQKEYLNNLKIKVKANDLTIAQIDGFLNTFSGTVNGPSKSDKLVYYNENTQLNDVIQTKDKLIKEQGNLRLELVNADKIVKENSSIINIENNESINGKLKIILPILFIFLYLCIHYFVRFYKTQKARLQ
ncbi:MAG TPA: hypothetical protein PLS51_09620 [Flavobacterium sp.]|jgi:hypothetical protein|nr:hypothetical protein [Flavobacterium sp.]HPJ10877.1 hypothetical protein [Flavobacterium sp.]